MAVLEFGFALQVRGITVLELEVTLRVNLSLVGVPADTVIERYHTIELVPGFAARREIEI